MYKMIAFDIDGTILPKGFKKLDSTINKMFYEIKEAGYILAYVTGRDFLTIGDMINNSYVDYFIGADGSFIYNVKTKNIEWDRKIIYNDYKPLINFCRANNIEYSLFAPKVIYKNICKNSIENPFWKPLANKIIPLKNIEKSKEDIYNIIINSKDENKRQQIKDFLKTNKKIWLDCEWQNGMFIASSGINKAYGISKLIETLGFEFEDVVAFGDGINDVSMLEYVGLSFAMENGCKEAKNNAKDICLSDVDYGPYKKLKELKII